jgi:hypothetical protein
MAPKMSKSGCASSSQDKKGYTIPDEVNQMMAGLVRDETMATIRNVDSFPDHKVDAEGNLIRSSTLMDKGKYKDEQKTYLSIYMEDKSYVAWVRTHINESSHPTMKKFRVCVAHMDKAKIDRINQEAEHQSPMLPKATQRSPPVKNKMENTEMTDWEVMTEDLGTNVDKDKWVIKAWEGMAIKTLDHNYMKRQRMIEKMARHPSGMNMMVNGLAE